MLCASDLIILIVGTGKKLYKLNSHLTLKEFYHRSFHFKQKLRYLLVFYHTCYLGI